MIVVECKDGLEPGELSPADRARYESFTSEHRRRSFLRGRKALAMVAGLRSSSLTHLGDVSVAAGANAAGVGIDREVCPAASPYFLTEDVPPRELTRLWTVKEALL